jgi:hypothetical protein
MQANSRFGRRQARSTPDILTSLMPALESLLMMLQGFSICIKISAVCPALPMGSQLTIGRCAETSYPNDFLTFEVQRSNWPTIK